MSSDRPRRKHTAVLAELIDPLRQRIVDVGCGQGALTRRLAKNGIDVLGIEPQAEAVDAARRHDTAARFLVGCGEALPLPDGSRDLVLYFNALHHVPVAAMNQALAEAHRVLAKGGRLVVVEPLAEGVVFELMRPVEDETEIRAAAEEALQRAAASGRWKRLDRRDYLAPVRYDSFDAFRDGLLAVDPTRAAAVHAHEAAMRQEFEAAVRHESDGYWLDQPCRLTVLQALPSAD